MPDAEFQVREMRANPDLLCGLKGKWGGVKETEWCKFAMERQADWMPATGKPVFERFELEHQLSLDGRSRRSTGLPRIDSVGWRGGRPSLIEAKVEVSPGTILGGIGQLLYYKQICQAIYGWEIEDLILISPAWPFFLLETVEANNLPITLVQITPEEIYCRRHG